jgi:hypothetical protein
MLASRTTRDALLCVAVVAGWAAVDLAAVVTSGEPYLVTRLLPGYLLALLVAAVTGFLCSLDRRIAGLLLAATAATTLALKLSRIDLAWHLICLPRAVFLLLAGFLTARSLANRSRPAFWPGVGCGAIVAAVLAFAGYRGYVYWSARQGDDAA